MPTSASREDEMAVQAGSPSCSRLSTLSSSRSYLCRSSGRVAAPCFRGTPELIEQVVDLILQRELGKQADGSCLLEALLQRARSSAGADGAL